MHEGVIGVDLGGTKLLMISSDREIRSATGPDFSPAQLESELKAFVTRDSLRPSRIGIAVPGLVDVDGRVVECDVLPAFRGWCASEALADLGCELCIVNDVKAALAEEMHDAPADFTGGVIMAGTAIGAAFMVDGRPLRGATGFAGELGYAPIFLGSRISRLDELAGGACIATKLGVTAEKLLDLAKAADPAALEAIQQAGAALGIGIATVVNLLNPSRLAVGGGALELPGYWQAALASAERNSLPALWRACALGKVRTGFKVVALGALRCASA